jgi:hypothetical protein
VRKSISSRCHIGTYFPKHDRATCYTKKKKKKKKRDIGHDAVAIWIFLLPLIIGWLHVGSKPKPDHLGGCLETANCTASVATKQRDRPVLAKSVTGHQALATEVVKVDDVPSVRKDELETAPVFLNYVRAFTWSPNTEHVLALVADAASNVERKIAVGSLEGGGNSSRKTSATRQPYNRRR